MRIYLVGAFAAMALSAHANLLVNSSFEADGPNVFGNPDGAFILSATGWTADYGYSGSWGPVLGPNTFSAVPDGVQLGFTGGDGGAGQMHQDVAYSLAVGEQVKLSVNVGHRADLESVYNLGGTGYVYLGTDDGNAIDMQSLDAGNGNFGVLNLSFTVDSLSAGKGIRVWLGNGSGQQASFDAADLTVTPVPEPASMAALGLGIAGLIRRRRNT